uniref:Uncharacterized protein n=1 Tax=Anguilla anguilla TaxID=7936 RepID=A0A0E9XQS7_ANGAN
MRLFGYGKHINENTSITPGILCVPSCTLTVSIRMCASLVAVQDNTRPLNRVS